MLQTLEFKGQGRDCSFGPLFAILVLENWFSSPTLLVIMAHKLGGVGSRTSKFYHPSGVLGSHSNMSWGGGGRIAGEDFETLVRFNT